MAEEKTKKEQVIIASDPQVIYLLTNMDKDGVQKTAYFDFAEALHEFNGIYASCDEAGYTGVTQAMYDDETYIKVAKLTKDGDVIRLRLENVPVAK